MSYVGGYNNGYAASNAGSAVPPGMGYDTQPPMNSQFNTNNYNQQPQQINMNGGGGGGGGCDCVGWCLTHNPFKLANNVGPDIMYAARYKQAMGLGLTTILVTAIAFILGVTFNIIPVLHLIPILLPCCHRGASPFWWSLISIGSLILGGVSLIIELFGNEALEAGVANGVVILVELVNLFVLSRMDEELKKKVRNCFAECGCCGTEAQLQTMVPQESAFQSPTQVKMAQTYQQPPPGPPGMGQGSYIGGGGSVVSGYNNPNNNNYQGSYAGGNPSYAGSANGYNQNTGDRGGYGGSDNGQHNWNLNGNNPLAMGKTAYEHRRRSYDSAQTQRQKQIQLANNYRPMNFNTGSSSEMTKMTKSTGVTPPPLPPNKPNAGAGSVAGGSVIGHHYLTQGPKSVTQGPVGQQQQKRKSRKVHASRRHQSSMEFEGMSDLNYGEKENDKQSQISGVSEKGSLIFNAVPMFEAEGRNFLRDSPPV